MDEGQQLHLPPHLFIFYRLFFITFLIIANPSIILAKTAMLKGR